MGFYYLFLTGDLACLNILLALLLQTGVSKARDTYSLTASFVKLGLCEGHSTSPPSSFSSESLLAPEVSGLFHCVESSQPWTGLHWLFSPPPCSSGWLQTHKQGLTLNLGSSYRHPRVLELQSCLVYVVYGTQNLMHAKLYQAAHIAAPLILMSGHCIIGQLPPLE